MRILLAHDGPELVVLADAAGRKYLGVASDESEEAVRWIQARTSDVEIDALMLGDVSIFDAIAKRRIWVVDQSRNGAVLRGWPSTFDTIALDDLPEPDARLAHAEEGPAGPDTIILDGEAVEDHSVACDVFTTFAENYQGVLTALVRAHTGGTRDRWSREHAQFRFRPGAMASGSLVIPIEPPKSGLAATISADFRRLVDTSGASAATPQVRRQFWLLVADLERRDLNIYPKWGSATFVSSDMAWRIGRELVRGNAPEQHPIRMETVQLAGTFQEYNRRGVGFVFEPDAGGMLRGRVDPSLVKQRPVVTPHESVRYRATITRPADQDTAGGCTLLDVKSEASPPEDPGRQLTLPPPPDLVSA